MGRASRKTLDSPTGTKQTEGKAIEVTPSPRAVERHFLVAAATASEVKEGDVFATTATSAPEVEGAAFAAGAAMPVVE